MALFGTRPTDAVDRQVVAGYAEAMLASHSLTHGEHLFATELDQLVALGAVQVIVRRVAIIVLVDRAAAERHLPQQARFDQFVERSVNSRPTDRVLAEGFELVDQLVGIEVRMPGEDMIDQHAALRGGSFAFALQVLFESLLRGHRHPHFAERIVARRRVGRVGDFGGVADHQATGYGERLAAVATDLPSIVGPLRTAYNQVTPRARQASAELVEESVEGGIDFVG